MDEQQLQAVANSLKNLRATAAQKATQPAAPTPAQKQQKQEAAKQKAAEQETAQPEQPSQSKRKSLAQRIADLEAREEKLKQQKRKLLAEQSKKARSADTHRKILVGGLVEMIVGGQLDTIAKREAFGDWLRAHWESDEDRCF